VAVRHRLPDPRRQHHDIAEAIKAGAPAEVRAAMTTHLKQARKRLS
jgi:DNA-binding GntR family transcriptional regulator